MAVNTHEIHVNAADFQLILTGNFLVIQTNDIEINDYIFFTQNDMPDNYAMVRVYSIVTNDGLKDGYSIIFFNKL